MTNQPAPYRGPATPEPQRSRTHPLHLGTEARAQLGLEPRPVQRLAPVPVVDRPPRRRPEPEVEIHRVEPERFKLWPWLGPVAQGLLVLLACAGIIALGAVTILTWVAWSTR